MSTMTIRRSYAGVPSEQRREQRRAALLNAALQIIGTEGFSALSIARLCRVTGLNDRYFAENFDSKEAMFSALIDNLMAELASAIISAVSRVDGGLRELAHAAVTAVIEYLTDDPRYAKIVFIEAPACGAVARRRSEVMDFFVSFLKTRLADYYGVDRSAQPDGVARFAGVALFGVMMETTTAWLDGALPITRDELIDHTTDLSVLIVEHAYGSSRQNGARAAVADHSADPRRRPPTHVDG